VLCLDRRQNRPILDKSIHLSAMRGGEPRPQENADSDRLLPFRRTPAAPRPPAARRRPRRSSPSEAPDMSPDATASDPQVHPDAMLPDLLRAAPHLRPVFDRYGLRGCGVPLGPAESVRYFARAHGVDEAALLRELLEALHAPASSPASQPLEQADRNPLDELADTIYRRFFKAGMVVILSAGAVWGAFLLAQIALRGSFTAISI